MLAIVAAFLPTAVSAQAIVGSVLDGEGGAPLVGAFVTLSGADGRLTARTLTDRTGRFTLNAPSGGSYLVRIEHIGYAPTEHGPFAVEAGRPTEVVIRLAQQAIRLEGLTVESETRCEIRPETGRLTARLWDDVGTALRVARWSQGQSRLRFRIATWERELHPDRLTVLRENREEVTRSLNRAPYASAPIEELQDLGYVRDIGRQGFTSYGPDADVLLSDAFLDTHCFRARVDDPPEAGWIGLAFEPVETSPLTDIRGVLWVDATTSELRRLDYHYTRLPGDLADVNDDRTGGQVDFERVPEGPWIVSRWAIRVPRIQLRQINARLVPEVVSIHEQGAEVLEMRAADDAPLPWTTQTATLEGIVYDGVVGEPVPGAVVRLSGTEMRTMTNALGRFRLPGVPEGSYSVIFDTPRLTRLPWRPTPVPVDLRLGETTAIELVIPPLERVLAEGCMVTVDDPGLVGERLIGWSVLVGQVAVPDGSAVPADARVVVTWEEHDVTNSAGDVRVLSEGMSIQTGLAADGRYSVCGLPDGPSLTVRVEVDGVQGPGESVALRLGQIRRLDLAAPVRPDPELRGTVVERTSGEPIESASVLLLDPDDRVLTRTATDAEGSFSLGSPEPGSYRVRVEAFGYVTTESGPLAFGGAETPTLEILLEPLPVELDP